MNFSYGKLVRKNFDRKGCTYIGAKTKRKATLLRMDTKFSQLYVYTSSDKDLAKFSFSHQYNWTLRLTSQRLQYACVQYCFLILKLLSKMNLWSQF